VSHLRRLAVHHARRSHDLAAVELTDALQAETHAEHRHVPRERADHLQRHARLVRRPRPRRDDDAVWSDFIFHFLNRHPVVAPHLDPRAQLAEILDEVVGERVVVVDQKKHGP
jgi:hypothetical protein